MILLPVCGGRAGSHPNQMAGGTLWCIGSCIGNSASTIGFTSSRFLIDRRFRSLATPSATKSNDAYISNSKTPTFLKFAVGGITELLRLFSLSAKDGVDIGIEQRKKELSVSGVDDVLAIIKSDYEQAYFLTGIFTSEIYVDDCVFEDPTIKFQGTDLYSRNLQLLVPFFEQPSIVLKDIKKCVTSEGTFVLANWRLRTYLKLPWRPLIEIDGSTVYDLNDEFKIVRHAESWSVSALEAVAQIFAPNFSKDND